MNLKRFAAVCALVLPVACGGGSSSPVSPPGTASGPPSSASETIAPSNAQTIAPLPGIGGLYGGQIVLPPGSGSATLTFSLSPPPGVAALNEQTPTPQVAYLTLKANSAFTLSAFPGLNLTVPNAYMGIVMWMHAYGSDGWTNDLQQVGWPSTTPGTSAMCFKVWGGAVSLQQGQSAYFGINGDNVIPTPVSTAPPPACPQT